MRVLHHLHHFPRGHTVLGDVLLVALVPNQGSDDDGQLLPLDECV
jgi:hypothetical protein